MMRKIRRGSVLLLVLALLLFVGCTGSGDVREDDREQEEDVTIYADWFLNPPTAEGRIYAVGFAQKSNRQLSLDAATARARSELASHFEVQVSTLIKDYMEEAGSDGNSETIKFSQMVSKQLTDRILVGSKVRKVHVDDSTDPHTFYVLLELNLKEMAGELGRVMESNRDGFSEFDVESDLEALIDEITTTKFAALEIKDSPAANKPTISYEEGPGQIELDVKIAENMKSKVDTVNYYRTFFRLYFDLSSEDGARNNIAYITETILIDQLFYYSANSTQTELRVFYKTIEGERVYLSNSHKVILDTTHRGTIKVTLTLDKEITL